MNGEEVTHFSLLGELYKESRVPFESQPALIEARTIDLIQWVNHYYHLDSKFQNIERGWLCSVYDLGCVNQDFYAQESCVFAQRPPCPTVIYNNHNLHIFYTGYEFGLSEQFLSLISTI